MRVAVKPLGGTGLGAPLGTGKPKSTAGGVQSVPSGMMKDEPGVFFKLADLLDTKAEQMITPAKPEADL